MSQLTDRITTAIGQPKATTVYFSMDDLAELGEDPADYGGEGGCEGVVYLSVEKCKEILSDQKKPRVGKRKREKVSDADHAGDGPVAASET